MIFIFLITKKKFKEIEFNVGRFLRDFPNLAKPLSVNF